MLLLGIIYVLTPMFYLKKSGFSFTHTLYISTNQLTKANTKHLNRLFTKLPMM